MNTTHWREIESLFQLAIERPASEWDTFLRETCGADNPLTDEVKYLLQCHSDASGFLEQTAAGRLSRSVVEEASAPREIGPYRIIRRIGHGGMGVVYLAERCDQQYEDTVAIKLAHGGFQDEMLYWRFRNERQILADLNHPNIARLFDGGTTAAGVPYLVMEYVEGEPIDTWCNTRHLSIEERLRLFREICSAVSYAHQNLVVHRDLKPGNILVTATGTPKLLDFGIAKFLSADSSTTTTPTTVSMLGFFTAEYASPEQIRGQPITTASDIYSLGVLLYQLLTGRSPYRVDSNSPHQIVEAVCTQEPARPSVCADGVSGDSPAKVRRRLQGDLDNVILMALRKQPEQRYASVAQFSADIGRHLDGLPVLARRPALLYYGGKFIRRHKIVFLTAAVAIILLLAGMVATLSESRRARREQARAESEKTRAERTLEHVLSLTHSLLFHFDAMARLPGSTEVRAGLLRDAVTRLDNLASSEAGSLALQREMATAYSKIGDIQGKPYTANLGDTEGALRSYLKASKLLEGLSRTAPGDLQNQLALSNAYQSTGEILVRKLEYSTALEVLRKALAIRERLAQSEPANREYQYLIAESCLNIGDPLQYQEDLIGSQSYYRRALTILKSLTEEEPQNARIRFQFGKAHQRVGASYDAAGNFVVVVMNDPQEAQGPFRKALDHYRASASAAEALLASDPSNAQYRRFVADITVDLGRILKASGDPSAALTAYRRAEAQLRALSANDPANAESRFDLLNVHRGIADAMDRAQNTRGAFENYSKAIQISEALQRADPSNLELTRYLRTLYLSVLGLQEKNGQLTAAIHTLRTVMQLSRELYMHGVSSESFDMLEMARLLSKSGDALQARGLAVRALATLKTQADRPGATAQDLLFYGGQVITCHPVQLRDPRSALDYCRRAVERTKTPNLRMLVTVALGYHANQQDDRAAEVWNRVLALLPYPFHARDSQVIGRMIERSRLR